MPDANLALLDTSVYIENFRTGRFTHQLLRSGWIIRCSAVVLHELRRGARREIELRFVRELTDKIRIITPSERQWLESAEILAKIAHKKGFSPVKLRDLAFDVLIALSAREIGATVVTCNHDDFSEILRHRSFKVIFW